MPFVVKHARALAAHLFVAVALLVWAAAAMRVPAYVIPGPVDVARHVWHFIVDRSLAVHVAASIYHVTAALVLAFVVGTGAALSAHYLAVTRLLVDRTATFLNSFSSIGWALLAIIWFGLNDVAVIFVIAIVILPVSIINMQTALEQLDPELLEMARSFNRQWPRMFRLVVLPMLYPFMFATLRLSFGIAWKVALTAELFGGNSGFGFIINMARQSIDTAQVFAVIVLMILIYFLADRYVFGPMQRVLSRSYADV